MITCLGHNAYLQLATAVNKRGGGCTRDPHGFTSSPPRALSSCSALLSRSSTPSLTHGLIHRRATADLDVTTSSQWELRPSTPELRWGASHHNRIVAANPRFPLARATHRVRELGGGLGALSDAVSAPDDGLSTSQSDAVRLQTGTRACATLLTSAVRVHPCTCCNQL